MPHRGVCLGLWLCAVSAVTAGDIKINFRTNASAEVLNDLEVEVGHTNTFLLQANHYFGVAPNLTFVFEENKKNKTTSDKLSITVSEPHYGDNKTTWLVVATSDDPGHSTLVLSQVDVTDDNTTHYQIGDAFIRFQIYHSQPLNVLSQVLGWLYFALWTVSFYPQVIMNWQRKSVVGYSFDYVALCVVGYTCYAAYNIGLFWIPEIKKEFHEANPHEILPVEANDVAFAIHAVVITAYIVLQVCMYERGGQKVSTLCRVVVSLLALAAGIVIILAAIPSIKTFSWLQMLSTISYGKLIVNILNSVPQLWLHFKTKTTHGWSIVGVLVDLTGGVFSILQMFVLAYNFNDWTSIFLNPVKFWLGALSIFFDIIFTVQHYCLYRQPKKCYEIQNNESETD